MERKPEANTATEERLGAPVAGAVERPFFVDHSRQKIDDKGRLILPASYRRAFADGGYVTYWAAGTLALLTPDEYQRRFRRIQRSLRSGDTAGQELLAPREALRVLTALSHTFQSDVQGRFVIKSELRERAGIDGEVEIVGAGYRIEVMPADRFGISAAGLEYVEVVDENHDLLEDDDF
jgi:MraZ protein